MNVQDIEILLGLTEILESHTVYNSTDWKIYSGLCSIINDKEWKESEHPRDEKGRFARSNGGGGSTSEHQPSPEYTEILESIRESNKANITPEDVIKSAVKNLGLDAEKVQQKIDYAEEYAKTWSEDTQTRYKKNGVYTEERQKLHDEILTDIFKNAESARPPKGQEPTVIFLGGRGGSGKSKFNGLVYDESKYIVLDADKIKDKLKPEYQGFNASEVHEESSEILSKAIEIAQDNKFNVVIDATMKSLGSTERKIQSFANKDYNIEMYYMHLPRIKAAERAISRFTGEEGGRYVPLVELLKMKDNEDNFDQLKYYASKWAFYNNDVPRKEDQPILIDKNY